MMGKRIAAASTLALSTGLLGLGLAVGTAPAQADPASDFLNELMTSGMSDINPVDAVTVGQSVCPMLADGGQNVADAAAHVSDALGRPLGPATMFTGLAISAFCPGAVTNIANGQSPVAGLPLGLLGF